MAEGGNAPEDFYSHPYLFGAGLGNTAWGTEADYSQYSHDAFLEIHSADPQVDSLFDCFNPTSIGHGEEHIENSWDSGVWSSVTSEFNNEVISLSQLPEGEMLQRTLIQPPPPELLDPRFAAPLTPPKQRIPHQSVVKQEYSPLQHIAELTYNRPVQASSVVVPHIQYGLPTVIRTSNLSQVPVPVAAPPSPISPTRRKRASSSARSTPCTTEHAGISKPKKRMIKPQVNGGRARMTPRQQELRRLIDSEGTGIFHQHIPSAEVGAANHAELMRMFAKRPEDCSGPEVDHTFPTTAEEELVYVQELYHAIWDWDDYGEMAKTLGAENMAMWHEAQMLSDGDPRKTALLNHIPSRATQQQKVLSRVLSDYIVEELCWRLVESYTSFRYRVAAMCDSLRSSKQLVKSLLSAGSGWCMRIANNPKGEFTHKVNNMKVNRRKNERLREATNSQKKEEM
ncbi:hypothetical protein NLG97_g6575 [Lecanicillium saksenae]|uniref:Uncharacterized protein n=1 Tax=Lecanicillium saksenae TaxID=468837 RepID=A0ACC1QRU7_9HYPO|nr:hypothetical protein NLG97_g6575 [Lecanicillium saksenae]